MVKASPRPPKPARVSPESQAQLIDVPLAKIVVAKFNARENAEAHAGELLPSVRDLGLLQPVVCRPIAGDRYELICGERRYWASKAAKHRTIPAVVREFTDAEAIIAGVAENVCRKSLSTMQRARALAKLVSPINEGGAGMRTKDVATMIGKSAEYVSNHVRLLRLPAAWQQRVESSEITERMARSLIPFVDKPEILAAIERDRAADPTWYRTSDLFESSVRKISRGEVTPPAAIKPPRAAPSSFSRSSPAPSPRSPAPDPDDRSSDDERDPDQAFVGIHEGGLTKQQIESDYEFELLLSGIEKLIEVAQLDELQAAIDARRAKLLKKR